MVLSKDMKIAICFGLILGALLSICNMCFAADIETLDSDYLENVTITRSHIVSSSGTSISYVPIEPGYIYHVKNDTTGYKVAGLSYAMAIDAVVYDATGVGAGSTVDFYGSSGYLYVLCTDRADGEGITYTRERIEGLTGFVDKISFALSFINLNNIVNIAVPIIAISVLLGLGFYLLKRLLNRIKRAKGGV